MPEDRFVADVFVRAVTTFAQTEANEKIGPLSQELKGYPRVLKSLEALLEAPENEQCQIELHTELLSAFKSNRSLAKSLLELSVDIASPSGGVEGSEYRGAIHLPSSQYEIGTAIPQANLEGDPTTDPSVPRPARLNESSKSEDM